MEEFEKVKLNFITDHLTKLTEVLQKNLDGFNKDLEKAHESLKTSGIPKEVLDDYLKSNNGLVQRSTAEGVVIGLSFDLTEIKNLNLLLQSLPSSGDNSHVH